MKFSTISMLGGVSAAALLALAAAPAYAQSAGEDSTEVGELVVTGVRAPRSRLETVSPVDVISADALQKSGTTELAQNLSTLAPSVDFPRPSITDGTDSVRPATLRGLAPDQTLMMVNNTRRRDIGRAQCRERGSKHR
jgi:iron complex outermembrane receptor protein